MKVQILGTGCSRCKLLEEHARQAIAEYHIEGAEIENIKDIEAIMRMGVMSTPGLAVDGVVKSTGRVLTKEQIADVLTRTN
ncbi:MAG TPA: thioredoxin family protein [Rectinemataceae bacterium]|nr:thioredoxin family protein [Rectinemataceae bacterium]